MLWILVCPHSSPLSLWQKKNQRRLRQGIKGEEEQGRWRWIVFIDRRSKQLGWRIENETAAYNCAKWKEKTCMETYMYSIHFTLIHLHHLRSPFFASLCFVPFSSFLLFFELSLWSLLLFPLSYLHCDVTLSNKHVFLKEVNSTVHTEAPFIQICFLLLHKSANSSHVSPASAVPPQLLSPLFM